MIEHVLVLLVQYYDSTAWQISFNRKKKHDIVISYSYYYFFITKIYRRRKKQKNSGLKLYTLIVTYQCNPPRYAYEPVKRTANSRDYFSILKIITNPFASVSMHK